MLTIPEVMSKEVKRTMAEASAAEAAKAMRDHRVGALLVEKQGVAVGIVTETDVVRKAAAEGKELANTTVESIMTVPLNYIDTTQTILDANELMRRGGVRHLAVREAGRVVGILSVADLARYFTWLTERKFPPP